MKTLFLLAASALLPATAMAQRPPQGADYSAAIEGAVTHPLTKTRLLPMVRAVGVGARPMSSKETFTAPNGAFHIGGLAPGDYVLCARIPNRDLIDPCFWGTSGLPIIRVGSGQTAKGNSVALTQGRKLDVVIHDPQRLTTEKAVSPGSRQFAHLLLTGPSSDGHPIILSSTRPEPDGHGFDAVIPQTGMVRLSVEANGLQVANTTGQEVAAGRLETVLDGVAGGARKVRVDFHITGKAAATPIN